MNRIKNTHHDSMNIVTPLWVESAGEHRRNERRSNDRHKAFTLILVPLAIIALAYFFRWMGVAL